MSDPLENMGETKSQHVNHNVGQHFVNFMFDKDAVRKMENGFHGYYIIKWRNNVKRILCAFSDFVEIGQHVSEVYFSQFLPEVGEGAGLDFRSRGLFRCTAKMRK